MPLSSETPSSDYGWSHCLDTVLEGKKSMKHRKVLKRAVRLMRKTDARPKKLLHAELESALTRWVGRSEQYMAQYDAYNDYSINICILYVCWSNILRLFCIFAVVMLMGLSSRMNECSGRRKKLPTNASLRRLM